MSVFDSIDNFCPCLSIIVGFEDVGLTVIYLIPVCGYIKGARVMNGFIDNTHPREFGQIFWGNVRPIFTTITGNVDFSIVRSGPNRIDIMMGWC